MSSDHFRLVLGVLLLSTIRAAFGHHSGAIYDREQVVTVSGTVARYDWANPHVYVYVEQITDAGAAVRDSYDEPTMSPALDCRPYSAPLLMIDPDFKQIVVDEDVITIRGGFATAERTIHMNVTTHEGAARTVQGHSIGRWEGDTLVIETTHFADHRIGNGYRGIASGAGKHLVERLALLEGGTRLSYEFELTDSEFLAVPVTGAVEWAYRPDLEFVRDPCELDNARQFASE